MSNTAPFGLGKTHYGESETIDVSSSYANVNGIHLEGRACYHGDVAAPISGALGVLRSSDIRKTRIVRNCSGVTLQGGMVVYYSVPGKRVGGKGYITAQKIAGVVDSHLGTTGVRDGDLFHIVVDGAVLCKTPIAPGDIISTNIAVGDNLFALTAATSGATTAGRLRASPASHSTLELTDTANSLYIGNFMRNVVGVAMSAATTANTNADLLVDVRLEG